MIASGVIGTTYSNTGLAASTTYYYLVKAVDAYGTSAASNQATNTTQAGSSGSSVISIDAGGAAVSNSGGGDNSFVADEDFTGGSIYSITNTITIPANVTATAAPAAVYQSARQGVVTYTIPGLTAGASYNVRLHFAELYFSAAGGREFNVAINGTTVLTNFDIYATAGGRYGGRRAVLGDGQQQRQHRDRVYQRSHRSAHGQRHRGAWHSHYLLGSSSTPTDFTATATSSSAIGLSWSAVTPPANCTVSSYSVYGGKQRTPPPCSQR